jgi:hypothetical protein
MASGRSVPYRQDSALDGSGDFLRDVISTKALDMRITFRVTESRKKAVKAFIGSPPNGYSLRRIDNGITYPLTFEVTGPFRTSNDADSVYAVYNWELGPLTVVEYATGWSRTSVDLGWIIDEILVCFCPDPDFYLSRHLPTRDGIERLLVDYYSAEGPAAERTHEGYLRSIRWVAGVLRGHVAERIGISEDMLSERLRPLVPSFEQIQTDPGRFGIRLPGEPSWAPPVANPMARQLPPHTDSFFVNLTPPPSADGAMQIRCLNAALTAWRTHLPQCLEFYEHFVAVLDLVRQVAEGFAGSDLPSACEPGGELPPLFGSLLDLVGCEDVVLPISPNDHYAFWSHVRRGMRVPDSGGGGFPPMKEKIYCWSERAYIARHLLGLLVRAVRETKWTSDGVTMAVEALIRRNKRFKLAKTDIDTVVIALVNACLYSLATRLVIAEYGDIPEHRFTVLHLWRDIGGSSDAAQDALRAKLLAEIYRTCLFAIGHDWEVLVQQMLLETGCDVASDLNGETTLVTGLRPDFALDRTDRDPEGRIVFAETLVDAKKSVLAVDGDVEVYGGHCKHLIFYVLDDTRKWSIPGIEVTTVFAADWCDAHPDSHLVNSIRRLLDRSRNIRDEVKCHFEADWGRLTQATGFTNQARPNNTLEPTA